MIVRIWAPGMLTLARSLSNAETDLAHVLEVTALTAPPPAGAMWHCQGRWLLVRWQLWHPGSEGDRIVDIGTDCYQALPEEG